MKKLTKTLLVLCGLVPLLTFAQNGQYDLRIEEYNVDYVNMKYLIDVEVKAHSNTTNFNISDQNYRMSFERSLANPQIEEEFLVGFLENSLYQNHHLNGTIDTVVSYNIVMAGGPGVRITDTAYVKIGRLSFDIVAPGQCLKLWFHDHHLINFPPTFIGEKVGNSLFETDEGDYINSNHCPINIFVNLEGALDPVTKQMNTKLNELGLLPGQMPTGPSPTPTPAGHPFNKAPWNYQGLEAPTSYASDIVDWIIVELREDSTRASMVYQSAALLHADGWVELKGTQAMPNNHPEPLYLFLSHQSHLPIFVKDSPLNPSDFPIELDLRNQQVNEGIFNLGLKEAMPGTFALHAGAIEKGTYAEIAGADLVIWSNDNGLFNTYRPADLNLDGEINAIDKILWSNNNGIFTSALEN